jgi:putative transposase
MKHKEFTWRKLPHIQYEGAIMFVTFRLYDSLPKAIIDKLKYDFDNAALELHKKFYLNKPLYKQLFEELHTSHFRKIDDALHKIQNGPQWLGQKDVAERVAKALQYWDGKRIELLSYCIMPNYVHIVFRLLAEGKGEKRAYLNEIMHSIKSFSAKECNKVLGGHGNFWTDESYDRIVRDRDELFNIINYVLDNPVKAGLCSERREWRWSYLKEDYNEFV